jgi:MFS family permease
MSRFDGGRQGFGTWLIGVIITVLFAAGGAILGSKYNVLSALNLPRIPVHEGTLATGAAITLAAIVLGTLIAAMLGGRIGRRYHRKVDRVAST